MYDLHQLVNYSDEMDMMNGKGRIIKARLLDQEPPNVCWVWVQIGNCWSCKHFVTMPPKCLNPDISKDDFFFIYNHTNTCPGFATGVSKQAAAKGRQNVLDIMRAAGITDGEPSQRVVIITNEPWSLSLSERAHWESSRFLEMARHKDSGTPNDPSRGEYVDWSDDLERPTQRKP